VDVGNARPARACRREGTHRSAVLKGCSGCSVDNGGAGKQIRRLLVWFMVDSVKHVKSHAVCSAQCETFGANTHL